VNLQNLPGLAAAAVISGFGVWVGMATDSWIAPVSGVAAGLIGCWGLHRPELSYGSRTFSLARSPQMLADKRKALVEELSELEDTQELQRGVFEVGAELVGCVDETDARLRFTAALRRYWSCRSGDLVVWEKGAWRSLGGEPTGAMPVLARPVQLPDEAGGDLVLDLSPGTSGQGALILRGARIQPSLTGRSSKDQRYVAEVLRGQLALSLRRVLLYTDLQTLARLDPLTGTHRRWYGESRLKELVNAGEVVAVAMVDIDHFKRVNDEFGHSAGDEVLAAVGRALAGLLRTGDLVCRFGGEEFLVILPETGSDGAQLAAERLRARVASLTDLPIAVTVSIGVAACAQDETLYDLVARADVALFEAKKSGRDRVVMAAAPSHGAAIRTTSRRNREKTDTRRRVSEHS
jgi:diguanylate cyclase (GGDEF)-like protein